MMSSFSAFVYCVIAAYVIVANANTFCEMSIPTSTVIHRFEGKMNVPIRPKVEPHAVLFLWPGVNPYGGEGGLMQPVITYGQGVPTGNWGIAQWFSDCPGYCHDPYKVIKEGDTIIFYMQYISTYSNGSQHWEMGYKSYNNPETQSKFQIYREGGNPKSIWATEAEFYLNSSDPNNFQKLPASSFFTWDLYAFTSNNNQSVKLEWSPHNDDPQPGNFVNCSVNVVDSKGTMIAFPNNNGCETNGYSRTWNSACQSYCGCNNNDGTKKPECDYCCYNDGSNCHREDGPSFTKSSDMRRSHAKLIHPGNIH